MIDVGVMIRSKRKEQHLSQKALGEIANVPESTVANYEAGKYKPTFDVMIALFDALCIEMTIDGKRVS